MEQSIQNPTPKTGGVSNTSYKTLKALSEEDIAKWTEFFGAERTTFMVDTHNAALLRQLRDNSEDDSDEDDEGSNIANVPTNSPTSDKEDAQKVFFGSFDPEDFGLEVATGILPAVQPYSEVLTVPSIIRFGDLPTIEEEREEKYANFMDEYERNLRLIGKSLMEEFACIELENKEEVTVTVEPEIVRPFGVNNAGPAKTKKDKSVRPPAKNAVHADVQCDVFELGGRNTHKKVAKYKLDKKPVLPKEARAALRQKARDYKYSLRDPLRGRLYEYESQMNFSHTVDVSPSVTELVNRVMSSFSAAAEQGFSSATDASNNLFRAASEIATAAKGSVFQGSNLVDAITGALTKCMWMVPLIAAAYFTVTSASKGKHLEFAAGLGAMLSMLLPAELWDMLKSLWPANIKGKVEDSDSDTEEWFDAQSGISIGTLSHLMTLTLTYITSGKGDLLGIAKDFTKSMPSYSRSVSSWKELSSFVISITEDFVNFLRTRFGYDRITLFQAGIKRVDDWCKKVMEVLNASHTGGDIMTPDTVATIIELRNEGKILTEVYRFTPEVSPMLHRYLNSLDEICKVCSAAMHMAKGGRAPPVVLMLTGEPGVGKTYLTKCITSYVLSEIIPRERAEKLNMNFDSEVFQKGKSEYWNGYCGQKAVIIDDFAQNVEVAGMDNDWIDLIRMNSCWAYPLNFADLENKGKNFYVSEFIMATTNIKDIDKCLSVIIEPGAITRRIDFGYVVEVAPEFKKGKHIDIAKVDAYARETGEFPFHAWILKKHTFAMKPDNVTDHSRIYNLKDVMDDVCEKIRRNKQYYESTNDIIANMVRKKYDYESQSSLTQWLFRYREDQTSWWRHFRTQYLGLPVRIDDISLPEDDDHPLDIHGQPIQWTGYRYLWGYQRGVQLEIQGLLDNTMLYLTNPIVQLILTMTGSTLLFMFLRQMSKLVYMWFSGTTTSGHKIKTKRSLMRKKKVPDECLAQALDTFRPEDFEHIEEKGGTYVRVMKFTEDTIKRAYERIVGHKAQSNEPDGPRFVYRKITASRVIESDEATAQADMYGDSIIDVANKNSFQIQVVLDGKKVTVGHILFIRDTFALMPAHFDSEFRRVLADGSLTLDDDIKFVNAAEERLHLNVKVGDFMSYERRSLPEDDITLVKFGPTMRAHRDICDKFIRDSDLKSMRNIRVRLDTHEGTERFIQRSRHMNATRKEQTRVKCDGVPYTLATSFEYLGYTRAGDCGGVVGLEEAVDKQCRRIIGLHTAGIESLGLGLCSILTQEKIAFLIDGRGAIKDTMYDSQAHMELVGTYVEGSFIALNKMERSHCMNPVSSLVRTKLYAKWGGGIKIPAPLKEFVRDGKRINPMKNAVLPYGSAVRTYDQDEVSRAAHHAFSRFRELTKDSERRIYSFEEAVAGIAGTNVNGIPRNTSPGYPYVLDGMTNKKLFFGGGDTYEFTSDACLALKAECQRVLDDAALGIRNPHWFVDFLKDELRAPAKAEAGLTRLISSCPMVYLIAFRQMFLAFTRAVQDTRIRNGVAVGINPYTEWDYLTQQMKSKGPHCVAGDFKGFDSSEQPDIHWAILNQINAWYDDGPRNALIRKVLWLELVHSRHIGGLHGKLNISYQWNKSLPSGHPMTSIVNSFYNLILFNMVWVRSVGIGLANRFWDLVYICTYGDDNILNISPEVVKKFNQSTIEKHMADLGMVYTNENKEGDVANTRPISEISFLKRGFRYEDSVRGYVGPQELDSILYVPYWSKNKSMIDDITLCNVEFTYQELSLHGDEVWNKYAFPIRDAVREVYKTEPQHYFDRKEYVRVSQTSTMVWPV